VLTILAAISFLLTTVTGYVFQVKKLFLRHRQFNSGLITQEEISEGLTLSREFLSFLAFYMTALSGLSRSYLDWFLVGSRTPVIFLCIVVLYFLSQKNSRSKFFFLIACFLATFYLLVLVVFSVYGHIYHAPIRYLVDALLIIVILPMFFAKFNQAYQMQKSRMTRGVSIGREIGLIIKDLTGLLYCLQAGSEFYLLAFMHILSGASSFSIFLVKYRVEKI